VTNIGQQLAEVLARLKVVLDDPAYQENLKRIEEGNAEYERVQAEHRKADKLRRTGVPPEVAAARPNQSLPRTAVADFLAGPPSLRFLTLSGRKGCGKTFAAAEAVWERGGRYTDAGQLVALSTFDEAEWGSLSRTPLLVVDELGAEHPNPAFEANLYGLLDRRYRQGKRTILCTNLNAAEFKARYCENGLDRLLDRLRTGGRWVSLDGPSLRKNWQDTDDREDAP
jgi:DNA replication protein DnaC